MTMKRLLGTMGVTLALAAGCGDDSSGGVDCSTSTLTYDSFGEDFFADYCDDCHTTDGMNPLAASARGEAKIDTQADIKALSADIDSQVKQGLMPYPTAPQPSAAEKAQLAEWLSCGAP